MRRKHKHDVPASTRDWLCEVADAYLDAFEAIPYGAMLGDTITESELFHMAPQICHKFRGIKSTKTLLKKSTEGMLSCYVATQDQTPNILSHPHVAFAFAYLACHFVIDILPEHTVGEIMDYIEEHQQELGKEIETRKKRLANQAL